MSHFCLPGDPEQAIDTLFPASKDWAIAYVYGGASDGTGGPVELMSQDSDADRVPAHGIYPPAPPKYIFSYKIPAAYVGKTFIGVRKGTNIRETTNSIMLLDPAKHQIDFMGKGKLIIRGQKVESCSRVVQLLHAWTWCSLVGRNILLDIFGSNRRVFIQIGRFLHEDIDTGPYTRSVSQADAAAAGATRGTTVGTGMGSDAFCTFNDKLELEEASCTRLHRKCGTRWDRPEFNLTHELTHASRLVRGKERFDAGDSRFSGLLEEELVCLINNIFLSEEGAPLRANHSNDEELS
jgi:hypothetical protein